MSKRVRESFDTSASAKQKPVHCSGLSRSTSTELEATPSVKTCVSKILKESPVRRQEKQALDNWKQQEHQLQQMICQVERTFISIQKLMERDIRKFDDPAKNFNSLSEEEHEFYKKVLDSICAKFGQYPTNLQNFPLNIAIWSQFTSD